MSKTHTFMLHTVYGNIRHSVHIHRVDNGTFISSLDVAKTERFLEACINIDLVDLNDMVKLFNDDVELSWRM